MVHFHVAENGGNSLVDEELAVSGDELTFMALVSESVSFSRITPKFVGSLLRHCELWNLEKIHLFLVKVPVISPDLATC
jgi:hypothetical protein